MPQNPHNSEPGPTESRDAAAQRLHAMSQPPDSERDRVDEAGEDVTAEAPPPPPITLDASAARPAAAPPPVKVDFLPHRPNQPAPESSRADAPRRQRPKTPTAAANAGAYEITHAFPGDSPLPVPEDDAVIVPAPLPQQVMPRSPTDADRWARLERIIFRRRAVIPILLTCGAMLPVLGILWFTSDPDSGFRESGRWLPLTLIALGAVMLLLAAVNMAQVRYLLREQAGQNRTR